MHKEFLMDQWIERIKEFLPTATVGKIQGQTFDVEGRYCYWNDSDNV